MPHVPIHHYAWLTAGFAVAFFLELSGAFRAGGAGIFATFILMLLVAFFGARWFAGFLAFALFILAFFMAPFWVLTAAAAGFIWLLLIWAAPLLTGNRLSDFSILLALGTVVAAAGGFLGKGEIDFLAIGLSLVMNMVVGIAAFVLFERRRLSTGRFHSAFQSERFRT
ncbi:MAG: hypothetical protein HYU81_03040 [Candidatus Brennerbacteria bacterium]|nr:hypothetical protein [Candidatus Brennerbacteria bacterium]